VTTQSFADKVERAAAGDRSRIKELLGVEPQYWNEPVFRIDIAAADQRNLRMPTGAESGANTLFVPGGYTSGGVPEAEIDPIPENRVSGRERCVAG
jgi:hypothetical protein